VPVQEGLEEVSEAQQEVVLSSGCALGACLATPHLLPAWDPSPLCRHHPPRICTSLSP
jgi:hypothetical protein